MEVFIIDFEVVLKYFHYSKYVLVCIVRVCLVYSRLFQVQRETDIGRALQRFSPLLRQPRRTRGGRRSGTYSPACVPSFPKPA